MPVVAGLTLNGKSRFRKKVIVELNGGHHAEQISEDVQRTAWLQSQGFYVLRFWNHQVLEEMEAVKAVIYQTLLDFDPPP